MSKPIIHTYISRFENKEKIFKYNLDLYQCKI